MDVRKIIHIDMDAFFAAVEQRDNPAYQGLPLAVGGSPEQRSVIAAASYEARAYGVHSAMSSRLALKKCPNLVLVPGRFEAYRAVSQQIRAIFSDYTDLIEPLSLDEAYLDVTEALGRNGLATHLAKEIQGRILKETNLTASAGVSYNKFLAKVASDFRKPFGLFVVPPQQGAAFVRQLPIGRFYGIGQKTEGKLLALGIRTGDDLHQCTMPQLAQLFGKSAAFYYGLARGVDHRPVESEWIRKSVGAEQTFPKDLFQREAMLSALSDLNAEVFAWMTNQNTFGRTVTLKVKYPDFQSITRSQSQSTVVKEPAQALEILSTLLSRTEALKRGVRLLGVSISNFQDASTPQTVVLEKEPQQLYLPIQTAQEKVS